MSSQILSPSSSGSDSPLKSSPISPQSVNKQEKIEINNNNDSNNEDNNINIKDKESSSKDNVKDNNISINQHPKRSHNIVEKKYRSNINSKFIELKNVVPTLRILDDESPTNFDELEGLTPASKLNKASILSKATEYIKHLKSKNDLLINEIRILQSNPNYVYKPQNDLHNLPIEVISNLPNQPQMSQIIMPNNNHSINYNNNYDINNITNNNNSTTFNQNNNYTDYNTNYSNNYNDTLNNPSYYDPTNNYNLQPPVYHSVPNDLDNNSRSSYGYRTTMQPFLNNSSIVSASTNPPSRSSSQNTNNYNATQNNNNGYNNNNNNNTTNDNISNMNNNLNNMNNHDINNNHGYHRQFTSYPYANNNNNNINNNNNNLPSKLLVGGVAALIGSNLSNSFSNTNENYSSLNAIPILLLQKLNIFIQYATFFSCIYYFFNLSFPNFFDRKGDKTNSETNKNTKTFQLSAIASILNFLSPQTHNLNSSSNQIRNATNQAADVFPFDLTSFPTSFSGILFAYVRILNVSDVSSWKLNQNIIVGSNLTNPIEHTFNKIILLELFMRRFPIIGYILGFNSRIDFLISSLLNLSNTSEMLNKNNNNINYINFHIIDFIKFDPNFINSTNINVQISKILVSLTKTKSSEKTAIELYGSANNLQNHAYNSIYEYLFNTPTNKLNLFELSIVLWSVENIRARMVKFLSDIVNENTEFNSIVQQDTLKLINDIEVIESFIPPQCIKLIKCCKIFKSVLNPKNNSFLDDTLKMILLSVEDNLIKIKSDSETNNGKEDELLNLLRSSTPVLSKVLKILLSVQNSSYFIKKKLEIISEENRLSLICSIILHQYEINNYQYGRSLIKYLKNEKSRKFMCSDSISLMALIATFRTLVVVLEHEKEIENQNDNNNDIDTENYNDLEDEIEEGVDSDMLDSDNSSNDDEFNDNFDNISISGNTDKEDDTDIDSITENLKFEQDTFISYQHGDVLDKNDHYILENLLCGLRLYVGQRNNGNNESVNYDILSLHYGLQSELSHRLLELAKELIGYTE